MSFSETQIEALGDKLRRRYVKTREKFGYHLSYIEGWHAIAEANRIFGFDAWDRQTVMSHCVWQKTQNGLSACAYVARVRIRVRAGDTTITREGTGSGQAGGSSPGEAHDRAIKEAETDATKRALSTFGNPFGLALYDKEQRGVTRSPRRGDGNLSTETWIAYNAKGEVALSSDAPQDQVKTVRDLLRTVGTASEAKLLWARNHSVLEKMRSAHPSLRTKNGTHYVDALTAIYSSRLKELNGGDQGESGPSDRRAARNSNSNTLAPRRLRDKEHVRRIASIPCLICGRSPSQAHHVRYAQPRAMGAKVSDEWCVPLCATHHRAVHESGREKEWWDRQGVNPIDEAKRLWDQSRGSDLTFSPHQYVDDADLGA